MVQQLRFTINRENIMEEDETTKMEDAKNEKLEDQPKEIRNKQKLYNVWRQMRDRCTRKKNKDFHRYGGRGIRVCDEWEDYIEFKIWAYTNGYRQGLTIERIDYNGNYCPENCEWIPQSEQSRNRCTNVWITYKGKTQIQQDWAKELKVNKQTIRYWRTHGMIEKKFRERIQFLKEKNLNEQT